MMAPSKMLCAGLAAGAVLAGGAAAAKDDFGDAFFVRRDATAAQMLNDRKQCADQALGLGGTAAEYSNPQYGALTAMGDALDEDSLHEGGLHKRMRRAVLDHCMENRGWTRLDPEGPDARTVAKASLRHPEPLDAWLKGHEPPPPAPEKPAATPAGPATTGVSTTSAPAPAPKTPASTTAAATAADGPTSP